MTALINNYSSIESPPTVSFTVQPVGKTDSLALGAPALNEYALRLLKEFKTLSDNWDGDGAKAPSQKSLLVAESLVQQLQQTGQKVYHVAPGPNGEIMVDLRENGKSVEILFYPDKMRYVYFPNQGNPQQGEYHPNVLPQILGWLHA